MIMQDNHVYGGFAQSLFFSGSVSIPRLLLDHYTEIGLTDRQMMLIIHIITEVSASKLQEENIDLLICTKMGISITDLEVRVNELQDRGILEVSRSKINQNSQTYYDLSGLIDQLFELWGIKQYQQMSGATIEKDSILHHRKSTFKNLNDLTSIFEKELGRPLTGFECEHIEKWLISAYTKELIVEALRRGVSAGIRSFRYIDSILREWDKKGIKTKLEVETEDEQFQNRQTRKNNRKSKPESKSNKKYDNIYL